MGICFAIYPFGVYLFISCLSIEKCIPCHEIFRAVGRETKKDRESVAGIVDWWSGKHDESISFPQSFLLLLLFPWFHCSLLVPSTFFCIFALISWFLLFYFCFLTQWVKAIPHCTLSFNTPLIRHYSAPPFRSAIGPPLLSFTNSTRNPINSRIEIIRQSECK